LRALERAEVVFDGLFRHHIQRAGRLIQQQDA
jgi:hypothetical protein